MARNLMIRVKVSEEELRLIRIKMKNLGYSNRSQFFRDLVIKDGLSTLEMQKSVYNNVNKICEKLCISKGDGKENAEQI